MGERMRKRAVTWISYTTQNGELGLSIRVSVTGKLADDVDSAITKLDDIMRANGFKPREEWRQVGEDAFGNK